jgi:hypothetical protein
MEAICSSETSVDTLRTSRRYIPEDGTIYLITYGFIYWPPSVAQTTSCGIAGWFVNIELKGCERKMAQPNCKAQSLDFMEGLRDTAKSSVKIVDARTENWTPDLLNFSQYNVHFIIYKYFLWYWPRTVLQV